MHVLIAKMYECNDLDEVSWRKLLCAFRNQKKLVGRNSRSINFPFGVIKIVIEIKVRNCRKVESSDSNWNTCVPICQISVVDIYGNTFLRIANGCQNRHSLASSISCTKDRLNDAFRQKSVLRVISFKRQLQFAIYYHISGRLPNCYSVLKWSRRGQWCQSITIKRIIPLFNSFIGWYMPYREQPFILYGP